MSYRLLYKNKNDDGSFDAKETMSTSPKKIVAIIGGTGAMGRPIIGLLNQSNRCTLRVLTRNAASEQAMNLARTYSNVELFEGNYSDEESVRRLLTSAYGVFCNTDLWNCGGFRAEIDQGKLIFNLAKELGVKHFIYSSLDHTEKLLADHGGYRCFHYDAKAIVAEYIESHDPQTLPWTILTTAPYFENFQSVFLPTKSEEDPNQLVFTLPMADKPFLMVAIDDIAWFVQYILDNPEKSIGKNFYIAGENVRLADLVQTFTAVTGIPAKYNPIRLEQYVDHVPKFDNVDFDVKEDFTGFYQQFLQEVVKRDFNAIKTIHPGLLTWRKWLEKSGWKGEQVTVQSSKAYYK